MNYFREKLRLIRQRCLRQILRGNRNLRRSKQLHLVSQINLVLTTTCCIEKKHFSRTMFGAASEGLEKSVRQFLLERLAGSMLTKAILFFHGRPNLSIVYPLPPIWRKVIEQHGLRVGKVRSAILWQLFIIASLFRSLFKIFKLCLRDICRENIASKIRQPYVYFMGLGQRNLPKKNAGTNYDIISWYLQWPGRKDGIQSVCHGVIDAIAFEYKGISIQPLADPIPFPDSKIAFFKYLWWVVQATGLSLLGFLNNSWWNAVMLYEAALAARMRLVSKQRIAREYLFNNSGWIYRPIWTVEAEQAGASTLFYFYSTNGQLFDNKSKCLPAPFGWGAASWPRYLVWDDYQADFLRRAVDTPAQTEVVGHISFENSTGVLSDLPHDQIGLKVAVFDVQPFRNSLYKPIGVDYEYYIPKTCIGFLTDISEVLTEHCAIMMHKRKRHIGKIAHPAYRQLMVSMESDPNLVCIDPDISAVALIQSCDLVISMPFTSTGILAALLGKPTVYYDSCGGVMQGDCAAHGIDVIIGKEALREWVGRHREISILSEK